VDPRSAATVRPNRWPAAVCRVFDYYFGIYHWRRRGRRIGLGVAVAAVGAVAGGALGAARAGVVADAGFVAGLTLVVGGLWYAQPALKRLLVPAPWQANEWKYAPLAEGIDWTDADRWVDLGCGTGRSLVGLADAVPDGCRATALDVFDARVILGNGARLAERNAARAGVDASAVRGDAASVPLADDSQDVVTACRLLHDLPKREAAAAVDEARRVLREDGTFGVLELPVTHDETDDPLDYWERLTEDGGFTVVASGRVQRGDSAYFYLLCEA
jgi:SAM-dependent methyltransferase